MVYVSRIIFAAAQRFCHPMGDMATATEYVWAHNLIGRLRGRFPKTVHAMERYAGRAD